MRLMSTLSSLIILGCVSYGCGSLRDGPTELARHLGMKPFGPGGGYPLGTLVAVDENGLPDLVIPNTWLVKQGQLKERSQPISDLPNMVINTKTEFQQSLNTGRIAGAPMEAKQALNDVSGFEVHISKARRNWFKMGPMALIDWLTSLDRTRQKDACILEKIHLAGQGRQLHYIYEVVEVQQGRYEATWNRHLTLSAKTVFEELMGPVGTVTWSTDGRAIVLIPSGANVMVAYKSAPVPPAVLKRDTKFAPSTPDFIPRSRVNPCLE